MTVSPSSGTDGLVARFEVDDLQTRGAERDGIRLEDALLIRPAVDQGVDGALNPAGIRRPFSMGKSGDSAQVHSPLTKRMRGALNGMVWNNTNCII